MVKLDDYSDIVGKNYIENLKYLARKLKNKKVIMLSSTKEGGGVAEILHRLVPLLNELGLNCKWEIINGDDKFFNITKKMHNALQGQKFNFSDEEYSYYLKINNENSKNLDLNADFIVVHDPQPLPLIGNYNTSKKNKWIWRCHIDLSKPDLSLWKFLKCHLTPYDASIFSLAKFARALPHPQFLVAPSIDPLSDKNRDLSAIELETIIKKLGVNKNKPLILQVSRFDRFKNPIGVVKAYRLVKNELDCQLILAGGGATDDPEGMEVFEEVKKMAGSDEDIKLLMLPQNSNLEINALQRIADVVIQNSSKEGFGLVVTEAMWKEKPVIGGAAGGITIQIFNNYNGFLIHSDEGAAYRIRYLLNRPRKSIDMGRHAKEFVRNNFLITRHVRDYLAIFLALDNQDKNIIKLF
ncbi:MAG: glycosyltransferase [Actinobacteria bacterium]|nr:glycosyltransferase [Actinomycetota bacterium]MBU4450307.1 glycosyltransferase [Actinomycetota bacterium]MCG2789922.1 glycosyltransferase [Actinomycetes bacterium]